MQKQPHGERLSYILSTCKTRTTAGLTAHLGKMKAHKNSKGNDIANYLANTVADGQPLDAMYFKGTHTHLGQWTWPPYTTQPDEPYPPKTLIYTNLKTNALKNKVLPPP
jgi:hypothetical protein